MTKWKVTDSRGGRGEGTQWQRRDGDSYEMVEVVKLGYLEDWQWLVGHGTLRIADYDAEEVAFQKEQYGLEEPVSDDVMAECLFEACMADFDCASFRTEAEAMAHASEIIEKGE